MDIEKEKALTHEAITPLPPEFAEQLAKGTLAELPHSETYGLRTVVRLVDRPEPIPGVENGRLWVEYMENIGGDSSSPSPKPHTLQFRYVCPSNTPEREQVAVFEFNSKGPHTYGLDHRLVYEAFRKRDKKGTRLYAQAEHFFQQLANASHTPITLTAGVSQMDVLKLLRAHGFEVDANDVKGRELLEEIERHPETPPHFLVNRIPSEFNRAETIYRIGEDGVQHVTPERLTLTKVIQPERT